MLTRVSNTLTNLCQRPGNYPFCLGGEEFGVIAANLEPQGTKEFAVIVRKDIEALDIPHEYSDVAKEILTVSIGAASMLPDETDTIDDYIAIANARLYKAKNMGRNLVVFND